MSKELREAAKRIIEFYKGDSPLGQLALKVANGVLSDHPEDEHEDVFHWGEGCAYNFDIDIAVEWNSGELMMRVGGSLWTVKENPTRGDVRRLCRALGITLKEQPHD